MSNHTILFDHIHIISPNPKSTADWYIKKLGARELSTIEVRGTWQSYLELGGVQIIIRSEYNTEKAADKAVTTWGTDHFGFRVEGDLDDYCATLKEKGVKIIKEPYDFNPKTRLGFIEDPDGVRIELLQRRQLRIEKCLALEIKHSALNTATAALVGFTERLLSFP